MQRGNENKTHPCFGETDYKMFALLKSGSHTEISSIPIFVLTLKFLHSCGHWNPDHVTLVSHPVSVSVTILTNCSMCCDTVACVCFPF